MTRHGQLYRSDNVPPRSQYYDQGRFGRLFPSLPPFAVDQPSVRNNLLELGKPGGIMDANDQPPPANPLTPNPNNPDNPDHTAGVTFLGQFLDHDMTFDPTSSLERQVDPEAVSNFRIPSLALDSLYGSGRAASPHLYDQSSPGSIKLLIDVAALRDLPRNSQNTALIGDPRNDENLIVSQLHLAFLKFHNAVVDRVLDEDVTDPNEAFDEAQRLVRWHYQWIILHEFLPATVGQSLVDNILEKGRRFYDWRNAPFIPVEFSVAAYRFGHSQVRPGYIANFDGDNGNPFVKHIFNAQLDHSVPDPDDLSGGKRAPRRFVDWRTFFNVGPTPEPHTNLGPSPKPNKRIDTKLSSPLFALLAAIPRATQPATPPHLQPPVGPAGSEGDEDRTAQPPGPVRPQADGVRHGYPFVVLHLEGGGAEGGRQEARPCGWSHRGRGIHRTSGRRPDVLPRARPGLDADLGARPRLQDGRSAEVSGSCRVSAY
jgi:hypothetical protein